MYLLNLKILEVKLWFMNQKGFKMIKYPLMRNNFNKSDFKPIIDLLSKNDPKLTQGSNVEKI